MNIINKSANVASSFDLYKLVQSPERKKMTDIKGQNITLDKWVLYTEPDRDGKESVYSGSAGRRWYSRSNTTDTAFD